MQFPVVTICGSMRFYPRMLEVAAQLTSTGHIVLMPHDASLTGIPNKTTTDQGRMLDEMHRAKIRMSGSVYIVNTGGYVGESTRGEIDYATSRGLPVAYDDPAPAAAAEAPPPDTTGTPTSDADALCERLADLIAGHGARRRPTITRAWREEARLLLAEDQIDGEPVGLDRALWVLEWCQADPFWRDSIRSTTAFRRQFDRLYVLAEEPETRTEA